MGKACRKKFSTKTYRKRRGFHGRCSWQQQNYVNSVNKSLHDVNSDSNSVNNVNIDGENDSQNENIETLTPSQKKVVNVENDDPKGSKNISGYMLLDMEILGNLFSTLLPCPNCLNIGTLQLLEDADKKKGFASFLTLTCQLTDCEFKHGFYTSNKSSYSFDINIRAVYSMRSCGQGYAGLERFATLMNLPKPVTNNNYDKIVKRLHKATKIAESPRISLQASAIVCSATILVALCRRLTILS